MQYITLGKTGYNISRVSYGGIVSSVHYGGIVSKEEDTSDAYVNYAIEHGVNYFDVAPGYGDAQEHLGHSLVPYRKDVFLACKTGYRTYNEAKADLENSLKLLRTDYFDIYQMHGISSVEEVETAFSDNGVMKLMDELKKSGVARKIGFTAHSEKAALLAMERYDFDSVLFPYNWMENQKFGMGNELLKTLKEKNMGALCMKSMIERAWDDSRDAEARAKYPKSWCKPIDVEDKDFLIAAIRYVFAMGVDTIIPPGNIHHFRFAVEHADEILSKPFGAEDKAVLDAHYGDCVNFPFFQPEV